MTEHKDNDPKEHANKPIRKLTVFIFWIVVAYVLYLIFNMVIHKQQNPNSNPQSHTNAQGQVEVVLRRNIHSAYIVSGKINGHRTTLLLDTGATHVTVSSALAKQMGLPFGRKGRASTAAGYTTIYSTHINSLEIGQIKLYDINATISPDYKSNRVLLGMSALKHLDWSQKGNELILKTR